MADGRVEEEEDWCRNEEEENFREEVERSEGSGVDEGVEVDEKVRDTSGKVLDPPVSPLCSSFASCMEFLSVSIFTGASTRLVPPPSLQSPP